MRVCVGVGEGGSGEGGTDSVPLDIFTHVGGVVCGGQRLR